MPDSRRIPLRWPANTWRPAETVRSVSVSFFGRASEIAGGIKHLRQFVVEATFEDSDASSNVNVHNVGMATSSDED